LAGDEDFGLVSLGLSSLWHWLREEVRQEERGWQREREKVVGGG